MESVNTAVSAVHSVGNDYASTMCRRLKAMESDLVSDLSAKGHDPSSVLLAVKDVSLRLRWSVGSECLVFGRSAGVWCDGEIADLVVAEESNAEWLVVQYQMKRKRLQRFSAFLKPNALRHEYEYDEMLISEITKRLKTANIETV